MNLEFEKSLMPFFLKVLHFFEHFVIIYDLFYVTM